MNKFLCYIFRELRDSSLAEKVNVKHLLAYTENNYETEFYYQSLVRRLKRAEDNFVKYEELYLHFKLD